MRHYVPKRRDPFEMHHDAIADGWQAVDTIPLKGEGEFMVLTLSGMIRLARNRRETRNIKPADGYGPMRTTVGAVVSGNYLAAIAWRWPN